MFLTPEELRLITGRTQPAAQCKVLQAKGYVFEPGPCGPLVLRSYVERRLGGEAQTRASGPDPAALAALMGGG